jgi:hypothetical protein
MAAASYVSWQARRFHLQAIWYICRRVLTPPQEAHQCTAAVSLGASTDMLCFAEVRPVTTHMQAPALAWALFSWSSIRLSMQGCAGLVVVQCDT